MNTNIIKSFCLTLICFWGISVQAQTKIEFNLNGLKYKVISGNKVSVERVSTDYPKGDFTIPSNVNYKGKTYVVTEVPDYAMQSMKFTSLTFPNTIKSIGTMAFWYCDQIQSVKIPSSVTNIGIDAFELCLSLKSIDVAQNNPQYKSVDGVLFTKDMSVIKCYPIAKPALTYIIPEGVSIIEGAVFNNSKLTSVTIPQSITLIKNYAFIKSKDLVVVRIPSHILSNLKPNTFKLCEKLKRLTIYYPDGHIEYVDATPYKKDK